VPIDHEGMTLQLGAKIHSARAAHFYVVIKSQSRKIFQGSETISNIVGILLFHSAMTFF
jgi:hypothetical protein